MTSSSRSRSLRGVTILEVLVASFVIVTGLLASLYLVTLILRATTQSNEEVIAANLAREALEGVRNVRDTNWQRNSGSQRDADESREHWNDGFKEAALDYDDALRYVPTFDRAAGVWGLRRVLVTADADLESAAFNSATNLFLKSPVAGEPAMYTDSVDGGAAGGTSSRTRFQRYVTIEYLEPDGSVSADAPPTRNVLRVTATVRWHDSNAARDDAVNVGGAAPHAISLTTTLSDWFGRKAKD